MRENEHVHDSTGAPSTEAGGDRCPRGLCLLLVSSAASPVGASARSPRAARNYQDIKLTKIRCAAAEKVINAWWAKQQRKQVHDRKVKGFNCHWKGRLDLVSEGTLTCKKRKQKFSVGLP